MFGMLKDWVGQKRGAPKIRDRLQAMLDGTGGTRADGGGARGLPTGTESASRLMLPATATLETLRGSVVAVLHCAESATSVILGRGPEATIRLPDLFAHRRHAWIRWDCDNATHIIEDLGGANGTYVDGTRVIFSRHTTDGCAVTIGKTILLYRGVAVRDTVA